MKNQLEELFDRPMDRKEFLSFVGKSLLLFAGISGLLNKMYQLSMQTGLKTNHSNSAQGIQASHGFGSSKFGV